MIRKNATVWLSLFALSFAGLSFAAEVKPAPAPTPNLLKRQSVEETISAKLSQALPQYKVTSVRPSPIAGLYIAQVAGSDILVTPDGTKFIQGKIFDIQPTGIVEWEDPVVVAERKKLLATVSATDSIVFKPAQSTKAVVYVFTDVDCGYCRKLNSEMADYNKLGIEIRYLAYPRAGIPSGSADKLITAWCSKDRAKAITQLKEEQTLPTLTCDNPVAAQFDLGGKIGVNGTPALWLPSGELKPGYLPPDQLAKVLGIL